MAMVRLAWRSFAFDLERPLVTAAGVVRAKRGWLLRLRNERGQQGWGEAAPLQLEARQTLAPLPALATAIAELGEAQPRELLEAYLAGPACPPSLGFALGAALAEADGLVGGEGAPAPAHGASATGQRWWPAPPGAELLPAGEAMLPALEQLLHRAAGASGPLSVKWKVAAGADGQERSLLELLLAQLPANARLRLDANGGWSRATAWGWAERLAGEARLQWLEQPLASGDQAGQEALAAPEGIAWLRQMAVIWVGGAALPEQLATRARQQRLRLAPCYGATETAAMVCALAPDQFLAGRQGCGPPLADVQLRLDAASGAVEVRTPRLSPGWLGERGLVPLATTAAGWWRSGDAGRLRPEGLEINGRLDGAINSGGETVFPEQLEQRLQLAAAQLPLEALLLLAEPHPEWGQILVALVRAQAGADADTLIAALQKITQTWPAAERPRRWCNCPALATTSSGKWQRRQWRAWLAGLAD